MNPNMSIYRQLNPRLLVQEGVDLDLLHWANMSNISLKKANETKSDFYYHMKEFQCFICKMR